MDDKEDVKKHKSKELNKEQYVQEQERKDADLVKLENKDSKEKEDVKKSKLLNNYSTH